MQKLCAALRRGGARIQSATNLEQARQRILEDEAYDIVICEHHLADGTGFELLGWLRWQQHIPVPFLLIARSESSAMQYMQDFSILVPPIQADRLLASVNALLREQTEGMLTCQIPFAGEIE